MIYKFFSKFLFVILSIAILKSQTVNVTFQVSMTELETDAAGAHISGEAFPEPGLAMSDPDGDDIWEITVQSEIGALLRYKFANGPVPGWQGQWEEVPEACQHEGNTDRWVIVEETDMVLLPVVFGTCDLILPTHIINDFDELSDASDEGEGAWWTEFEETAEESNFSTLTQITDVNYTYNETPVMDWSYGIYPNQAWGGFTAAQHLFTEAQDFSQYNYLSFKFKNLMVPQEAGTKLRVVLYDVEGVTSWSSRDDTEIWWSFFYDDESPLYNDPTTEGWIEFKIPLQNSGSQQEGLSYTQGFCDMGWVGIGGNGQLDLDRIGGIAVEVPGASGANVTGEFLIEDLLVVFSPAIPGCTDEGACNYNPNATDDDGSCYECSEITFRVDMSNEVPNEEGVYIAGGTLGQEGFVLDDSDSDNIYETTLELKVGSVTRFKYRNQPSYGTWNGFESDGALVSGGCSAPDELVDGQNYNDRYIIVPEEDTVLDVVCYGSCESCDAVAMTNVTFSVDMTNEEVDPAGVHLTGHTFGEPGLPMDDLDGDNVWSITVERQAGETLKYIFANGPVPGWQGQFEEVPSDCQSGEDPGSTDREVFVMETDMVLETVCFGKCTGCFDDYAVAVTFNLDMNDVFGFDGTEQPYVFGSYNNWDNFGGQTMLSDDDGDNIYTGTVPNLMFYDSVTVLFGYGSQFEIVPVECGVFDSENLITVRSLPLLDANGEETLILDALPYGACPLDNTPRVLFQVDVTTVMGQWPDGYDVCVTGSFDSWSGCGLSLTDPEGDGVYSGIVTGLTDGDSYEFKFLVNSGWNDPLFESGAPIDSDCDFTPGDGYNNYGFTAVSGSVPLDLGVFPWNQCPTLSNDDGDIAFVPKEFLCKAYPNPFNPNINIYYELSSRELVRLTIINILGQEVKTLVNREQDPGIYTYSWDGRDMNGGILNSGIYFAVINHQSSRDIIKITYLK